MKQLLVIITLATGYWLLATTTVSAASLSLEPTQVNLRPNQSDSLDLHLTPQPNQQIIGVDIILQFNPNAVRIDQVLNTGIFSTMPAQNINNSSGQVTFSLVHPYDTYQTSPAHIATINFTALTNSTSTITFDFTAGSTTDTNVAVQGGQDVLSQVQGTTITINQPGQPTTRPQPPQPTRRPTDRPPQNPGNNPASANPVSPNVLGLDTDESSPATKSAETLSPTPHPSLINPPQTLGLTDQILHPTPENRSTRNLILGLVSGLSILSALILWKTRKNL